MDVGIHKEQGARQELTYALFNRDWRLVPSRYPRPKIPHLGLHPTGTHGEDDELRMFKVGIASEVVHRTLNQGSVWV